MAGWNTPARNAAINKRPREDSVGPWSLLAGTTSVGRMWKMPLSDNARSPGAIDRKVRTPPAFGSNTGGSSRDSRIA